MSRLCVSFSSSRSCSSWKLCATIIKHIRAKPSALSQNLSQLLARRRWCIRAILSTRARGCNFILATTPSACTGAGRGREYYEYESRVHLTWSTTLLSLASKFFDNSSLYSFVFAVWGCDQICLSIRKTICWCPLLPQRWPRIAVKGIYRHNFRPVHF